MKCSNPQCNHGIGLVSYRRAAFTKGRYCSKKCRDSYVIELAKPAVPGCAATTYFEWLFLQPSGNAAVRNLAFIAAVIDLGVALVGVSSLLLGSFF